MIKIYDCSNSPERPSNRKFGGPIENDIIRYLKKYCHYYDCSFVDDYKHSDVIITNDVFPKELYDIEIPKIKRMDGIFFQDSLQWRNSLLNKSAQIADHVIFISEFSRESYFKICGEELKSYSVALNQVDPKEFYEIKDSVKIFDFVTIATSWERDEKRLKSVTDFVDETQTSILIIGAMKHLHSSVLGRDRIHHVDYLKKYDEIRKTINLAKYFLNLSFMDAAPKTVLQGLNCGLPVLFANSGGVPELVGPCGCSIEDFKANGDNIPLLDCNSMAESYRKFINNIENYKSFIKHRDQYYLFENMLTHYFDMIKNLV